MGEHAFGHVEGMRQQHAAGRGCLRRSGLERVDALEDAPLGLLAEALHRSHPPGLAGGPQGLHGLDTQGGVERLDLSEAEVRDTAELARACWQRSPDLLECLRPAGAGEVVDHRGQALTDPGQCGQPALGHQPVEFLVAQALQHPGATLVGARAERLVAGEGKQVGRLAEGARDGEAIHRRLVQQATCRRGMSRRAGIAEASGHRGPRLCLRVGCSYAVRMGVTACPDRPGRARRSAPRGSRPARPHGATAWRGRSRRSRRACRCRAGARRPRRGAARHGG